MASDMIAALSSDSSATLETIEKQFKEHPGAGQIQPRYASEKLRNHGPSERRAETAGARRGQDRVFKLRRRKLDANEYGQIILEETRKLNVGLGISVQQLVDSVQTETDASTWQARKEISLADHRHDGARRPHSGRLRAVRLALCRRNILRRIRDLQRSMLLLSDGDLESEIYRSASATKIARWPIRCRFFGRA